MARTSGIKTLLTSSESGVSIEVAEGVQSVIMKHIYTDFDSIRKCTPKEECLISPAVHLHSQDVCDEEKLVQYRFKAVIPHYLPLGHSLSSVKVRCGDIKKCSLREMTQQKHQNRAIPYYDVYTDHVTLYSNHFCDVVCSSTEKVCTTKVIALPFGSLYKEDTTSNTTTKMKMKTYICSYLYSDNSLQTVSYLSI